MRFARSHLTLYAVTDGRWLAGRPLEHVVELAVRGGATMVQLREKTLARDEFIALAGRVKAVTDRHGVPLLIDDDPEVCLACGADGVHVGQEDMACGLLRRRLGPDRIIGVSATTLAEALQAQEDGADYLGVGAVFPTSTKEDAGAVGLPALREICRSVAIPVVAIGGIDAGNVHRLAGCGVAGVSVISAVFGQPDVEAAARVLRRGAERMLADA